MHPVDKLVLLSELSKCDLNHGPGVEPPEASNCLMLAIGPKKQAESNENKELVIQVCQECEKALSGEEWTLLYCFNCCSSRWVERSIAKNKYRHHILFQNGCPDCTGKFGGLYFADSDLLF